MQSFVQHLKIIQWVTFPSWAWPAWNGQSCAQQRGWRRALPGRHPRRCQWLPAAPCRVEQGGLAHRISPTPLATAPSQQVLLYTRSAPLPGLLPSALLLHSRDGRGNGGKGGALRLGLSPAALHEVQVGSQPLKPSGPARQLLRRRHRWPAARAHHPHHLRRRQLSRSRNSDCICAHGQARKGSSE